VAAPGGPGGPAPGPGGPGGPAPAPPQVQAYQSAPDMQQLYLKFAQQQQADEQFNRGLGLLAASTYPGRHPEMIMNAMTGNTADPGALFGNIMKIQGYQQQQKQYEAFVNSAPDIAKQIDPSGGFTPNEVLAMGPDSVRTALGLRIPPDALRTRNAFKQQFITDHANDPDPANPGQKLGAAGAGTLFEQQNPMSLTMAGAAGGGADPQRVQMQADLNDWQRNNPTKPVPFNDVNSWQLWKARTQQETANRTLASQQFHDLDANLGNYVSTLSSVANDPKLTDAKAGGVLNGGMWGMVKGNVLPATSDAYPLYTKINNLQEQTKALAEQGGSLTKGSLLPLGPAAADLTKYGLSEDDYRKDVIAPLMKQTLTAQANNWGASGRTDEMPGYLKPYLDPIYQQNGQLYVKSPYAKAAPQPQQGMAPLTPKDQAQFKELMETYGPQKALEIFRGEKKDTSSLE
jgi:hypothetical protein